MPQSSSAHPVLLAEPTGRVARRYQTSLGLPCRVVRTYEAASDALRATHCWSVVIVNLALRDTAKSESGLRLIRDVQSRYPAMPLVALVGRYTTASAKRELDDVRWLALPAADGSLQRAVRVAVRDPWTRDPPGALYCPEAKLQYVAACSGFTDAETRFIGHRFHSDSNHQVAKRMGCKAKTCEWYGARAAEKAGMPLRTLIRRLVDARLPAWSVTFPEREVSDLLDSG